MNKLTFIPIIGIPEIKSGDNIPKIINKIKASIGNEF